MKPIRSYLSRARFFLQSHSGIVGYLILASGTLAALVLAFDNQGELKSQVVHNRQAINRGEQALAQAENAIERTETAVLGLCALRVDLDKRITLSQNLLDDNPGKKRIAGFDRSVIEMSLTNSKRTRETLNVLDCEEEA